MKHLVTLIFLSILSNSLFAQQALLTFDSGNTAEVYVTNIDSLYITTSKGRFALEELAEVAFPERKGRDEHLYFELSNANVVVKFDKTIEITELRPPYSDSPEDQLKQFKESMYEYKRLHQVGAGLQLSGVLLGLIGVLSDTDGFIYAGMATAATGFVIDINAAQKIR